MVAFFRVGPSYRSYLIHDFSFKATLQFGSSCFQIALTAMDTIHLPRPQMLSFCLKLQREVAPLCLDLIPLWIRLKKPEDSISTLWYFDIVDILWVFPCLKHHLHCASCHICSKLCLAYSKWHIWVGLLRLDGINVLGKLRADAAGWQWIAWSKGGASMITQDSLL